MSGEIAAVTGEVLKNASVVTKLKDVANANPIAAAAVGVVVLGLATWGSYKLLSSLVGKTEKVVVVHAPPVAPAAEA